jgi:hypothetical protein
MSKNTLFNITNCLKLAFQKQNTMYCKVVPTMVCVCFAIYKVAKGANFLTYSEFFVIGKSSISFYFALICLCIQLCIQRFNHLTPRKGNGHYNVKVKKLVWFAQCARCTIQLLNIFHILNTINTTRQVGTIWWHKQL